MQSHQITKQIFFKFDNIIFFCLAFSCFFPSNNNIFKGDYLTVKIVVWFHIIYLRSQGHSKSMVVSVVVPVVAVQVQSVIVLVKHRNLCSTLTKFSLQLHYSAQSLKVFHSLLNVIAVFYGFLKKKALINMRVALA